MPEVSWVVFNPWTNSPPGGSITASMRKRGAVLEAERCAEKDGKTAGGVSTSHVECQVEGPAL